MIRILKIAGRDAAAIQARLQRVERWMAARGWRLGDFAEEAGSALFERPPDEAPLGLLDATRWLPGPGALHPRQWLATLRADPRLALLPALLGCVGLVLGLVLFAPSSFDVARVRREAAAEPWYRVNADQLNVREGPGTQHPVVGVLYRDQRVLVEAEVDATWVKLGVPERGYVAREFLARPFAPQDAAADENGERAGEGAEVAADGTADRTAEGSAGATAERSGADGAR